MFANPHVLYNMYIVWMIAEPLVLMSLPYWRRNNERYAQSIYSSLKQRYGNQIEDKYMALINMSHSSTSSDLYSMYTDAPRHYTRSIDEQIHGIMQAKHDKELGNVWKELRNKVKTRLSDNDIFNRIGKKIPVMIFASIFQAYIGKADSHGNFKANIARYSAFNCLNLLNTNRAARTVEVRIKHGSDDPIEIKGYVDLFTELAIVAIMKGTGSFNLDLHEIQKILEVNKLILDNPDLSSLDDPTFDRHRTALLDIFKKHIFPSKNPSYKFMLTQISKMRDIRSSDATMTMTVGGGKKKQTKEKTWVFCYGSNGMEQLRDRVDHKGPWEYRPVVLKGHARIFSGHSGTWDGAVASIWPDAKRSVYGSIVKMTKTEIKKLDRYEGVGVEGWYYQDTFTVHDVHTKEAYNVMAYVKEDMEMTDMPSVKYLKSIEMNLKAVGLKDRQVGKALKIYGIPDSNMKVREIGTWTYGAKAITFKSKRLEKRFAA